MERDREVVDWRFCNLGADVADFDGGNGSSRVAKDICDDLFRKTGNFEGLGIPDGLFIVGWPASILVT